MRISDWSSDVSSSDLRLGRAAIGINDRAKEKQLRTGETILYLHGALRYIRHQHRLGRSPKQQEHGRQKQDTQAAHRSEEHTSELQSLMRNSYAVFCLKNKNYSTHANNLISSDMNGSNLTLTKLNRLVSHILTINKNILLE